MKLKTKLNSRDVSLFRVEVKSQSSCRKLASILLRLEMNAFILGGYGHHVKTLL